MFLVLHEENDVWHRRERTPQHGLLGTGNQRGLVFSASSGFGEQRWRAALRAQAVRCMSCNLRRLIGKEPCYSGLLVASLGTPTTGATILGYSLAMINGEVIGIIGMHIGLGIWVCIYPNTTSSQLRSSRSCRLLVAQPRAPVGRRAHATNCRLHTSRFCGSPHHYLRFWALWYKRKRLKSC
jgi:hypothetical protein